jgi:hypothetical protein
MLFQTKILIQFIFQFYVFLNLRVQVESQDPDQGWKNSRIRSESDRIRINNLE